MVAGTVCILTLSYDGLNLDAAREVHGGTLEKVTPISMRSRSRLEILVLITNRKVMIASIVTDRQSTVWFLSIGLIIKVRQSAVQNASAVGRSDSARPPGLRCEPHRVMIYCRRNSELNKY